MPYVARNDSPCDYVSGDRVCSECWEYVESEDEGMARENAGARVVGWDDGPPQDVRDHYEDEDPDEDPEDERWERSALVEDEDPDEDPEDEDPVFETSDDGATEAQAPDLPLMVAAIPGRPARMVSFEQEVGDGAYEIASALYEAGLSSTGEMWGYHSSCSEFVHVEHDASVDGEVIYSRLRLDRPHVARKLDETLGIVQSMVARGEVSLDSSCGFHVHVGLGFDDQAGARCFSMAGVESLYHLGNYVEDVFYRLGSSNWRSHRTETGNHYAPRTPKSFRGAVGIGNGMEGRRDWLNLSNFLAARARCRCGAFSFGAWQECTCDLPKPTVEFRVFNATANPRKVRAYVALCLALVAYAESHEVRPDSFPVHEWRGTGQLDEETAESVLRFILRDLPLTDPEREDVRYCAETSAKGERGSLRPVVARIRRRKGYRAGLAPAGRS